MLQTLRHTSDHSYYNIAPELTAQGVPVCETGIYLLFRIFTYGAGVEQHGGSLAIVVSSGISRHFHHGGDHFRISHVHLASVGFYAHFFRKSAIFPVFGQKKWFHISIEWNNISNFVQIYYLNPKVTNEYSIYFSRRSGFLRK